MRDFSFILSFILILTSRTCSL